MYTPIISVPDNLSTYEGGREILDGPDCTTLMGAIGWIARYSPPLARTIEDDQLLFASVRGACIVAVFKCGELYAEISRS